MTPKLTIIFACLNDALNAVNTIRSVRETAGDRVNIVVVDDNSPTPLQSMLRPETLQGATIVTNKFRCGCGPSRHIGVLTATTPYVLICDSHMVFLKGWYEAWESLLARNRDWTKTPDWTKTVLCATCLQLDSKHTDPENPTGTYQGGTMNVIGADKANGARTQVFEGIWHPPPVKDLEEIPCVMGACYILSREWFLHIDPLQHLRYWGCDEEMLSVKSWLAGGDCLYYATVKIGHKFLLKHERQPFIVMPGYTVWNRLFAIWTLCPPDLAQRLHDALKRTVKPQEWAIAENMLRHDWHIVAAEQARNKTIFTHDFYWYARKFNLSLP